MFDLVVTLIGLALLGAIVAACAVLAIVEAAAGLALGVLLYRVFRPLVDNR